MRQGLLCAFHFCQRGRLERRTATAFICSMPSGH
jgi:hypothetical protein